MSNWKLLSGVAFATIATAAIVAPAEAQVTTSNIRGQVVDASGSAVAGATVTVTDSRTGNVETATTSANGVYNVRSLRVGGPYTLDVETAAGVASRTNVFLQVNETFPGDLTLGAARTLETVVVTGTAGGLLSQGPSSSYGLETIAELPSINRDIRDIARLDPLVSVDETNEGAISIAGTNNRYNSLTIDGIKFNDLFGLNANGFPSQRSPISIDALEQLSVESAPYDVEFSGFTGGTVNVLTKSGTNEFHGSGYYFFTDDSLGGDRVNGRDITQEFEEKTWGVTLGGPIIKDKLFFFVAYEDFEEQQLIDPEDLPGDSGVSQAEYDNVAAIAQSVYGVDAGTYGGAEPVTDQKLLATIDWDISNDHRAKFTLIQNEGNELQPRSDRADLGSPSTWYNRTEETNAYAVQLFSDWTDAFSTEFKVAYSEQLTGQESLNGSDFALFIVPVSDDANANEVAIGPDEFRHGNELSNELLQIKAKGAYEVGNHLIKFGYEREQLDTFNLFIPLSEGRYFFDSLTDFQNRVASELEYQNAVSNNEVDAGATFGSATDSIYVQNEWLASDQLTVTAGLRYETYSTDSSPLRNVNFENRYGFRNNSTTDGMSIVMPRLGFNYEVNSDITVRGGIGKFSGGNPIVWLANNYSNDGVTTVRVDDGPVTNVDAFNIPQSFQDALQPGNGGVNAIDPDFNIPYTWRLNAGVDYTFDIPALNSEGYDVSFDYIFSDFNENPFWLDLSCGDAGAAPDGRPTYSCTGPEALLLTNADGGGGHIFTTKLSKYFDNGIGMFASYTYQDIDDVHSGTSSTASSNYSDYASFDRQNPFERTSNYEREHEFKLRLSYEKEFIENYATRISMFATRRSGQPFSYTYDYDRDLGSPFGIRGNRADDEGDLFYVPTGPTDPLLSAASFGGDAQATADFFAYLDQTGLSDYAGEIAPRNAFNSRWFTDIDIRLQQEIPMPIFKNDRDKLIAYVDLENVGNLLDDGAGYLEQVRYEYFQPVTDIEIVNGQYVYNGSRTSFPSESSERRITNAASIWKVQLGLKYQF